MNAHRTPPAVLQFRVLEALLDGPLELEQIVTAVDDADDDIRAAVRELHIDQDYLKLATAGTRYELTQAGRLLVRPRTFPGDTAHCIPGHVRGSKPDIVPLLHVRGVTKESQYVVRHGADYLDRAGRVVTQGTDNAHLHMTYAEARDAIDAHDIATARACEPAGVIVRDVPDRAGNHYRATLDVNDDGAEVGPWVRTVVEAQRILAAALAQPRVDDDGPDERPCTCGHPECGAC